MLAVLLASLALAAPPAHFHSPLDNQVSSNWAGYAVTGTNPATGEAVAYTDVTAAWVQPKVSCTDGESYSAFWVGLGGFTPDSQALEQIGTESDCTAGNRPIYSAWYEIVPAPSIPIRMKILPGDRMSAAVLVQGTQVILQITNRTRQVRVTKRVTVAEPDLSSAEWVAEAPSACNGRGRCQTLPLANFGTVSFGSAAATGDGHAGTLTDPAWTATPIELATGGPGDPFGEIAPPAPASTIGAVPGALSTDGRGFSVSWRPAAA